MDKASTFFEPERYTYNQYKLWEGNWELINGYPVAMSPSPKRTHQSFSLKFSTKMSNLISKNGFVCDCEVYYKLDWIVSEQTVVRPDVMVVCGKFEEDFLTFPPTLVLEITSTSTYLRDRNTKFNLYEMCGVKYYIIGDSQKKSVEIFQLIDNKYKQTSNTNFVLTLKCSIDFDVFNLWD